MVNDLPRPSDIAVLVTRPEGQSAGFIKLLNEAGLSTVSLPTIEISFTDTDLTPALECDLIIFTSVNSVNGANQLISLPWQTNGKIAAIGTTTANALSKLNATVDVTPTDDASTEALLSAIDDVKDNRVAIVRGDSGRETLKQELAAAGAQVVYFCVYNRTIPNYTKAQLDQSFSAGLPDIISITSDLGLSNFIRLIPQELTAVLMQKPLVVNSQRCAEHARQAGFTAEIRVARPPGDKGQLPEILHLANGLLTQR